MLNLLDVFKPDMLDENGRFGVRVALIAADDEFRQILHEVRQVATPETRARLAMIAPTEVRAA